MYLEVKMVKFLIRLIYLPLFLIVGNGVAITLVGEGYSEIWLLLLVAGFIALSFVFEMLAPYDLAFNKSMGDRPRDFAHAFVNESFNVIGVLAVPFMAGLIPLPSVWPTELPLWAQVLLAVFIADIGITLAHYASHRFEALWRLHSVHHSVKRMYGFNGLMKHPLHATIETVAGVTPLLLLGASQEVLMLLVFAVVIQLLLQHSNVAYFTGPFRPLLAINANHRFHHLGTAEEGDVNFGLFTTFTDYLLGTAYYDKDRKIGSDDIGIAARPDFPVNYIAEMIEPFRPYIGEEAPLNQ